MAYRTFGIADRQVVGGRSVPVAVGRVQIELAQACKVREGVARKLLGELAIGLLA
jgi:hypothetical protein